MPFTRNALIRAIRTAAQTAIGAIGAATLVAQVDWALVASTVALATILSEFSLLFPFYYSVRRHVGTVPWLRVFGPPLLSVAVMGLAIYALIAAGLNAWLAVAVGAIVYGGGLLVTGALRGEDMAAVLRSLPIGPLRRLAAAE